MEKKNYQLMLDKKIEEIVKGGTRPRLLLHCCCAPCSSYVMEYLSKYMDITCYYYNPNISPEDEYVKRADELISLIGKMPFVVTPDAVIAEYDPESFEAISRGNESEPEGGARCFECYRLRLGKSAEYARKNGYDYFTTTLSISPYKNAAKLNEIGTELAVQYGIQYLYSDFKKKSGYLRSCQLSAEYGLYRQDYCGCIFSKEAAERKKSEELHAPHAPST